MFNFTKIPESGERRCSPDVRVEDYNETTQNNKLKINISFGYLAPLKFCAPG